MNPIAAHPRALCSAAASVNDIDGADVNETSAYRRCHANLPAFGAALRDAGAVDGVLPRRHCGLRPSSAECIDLLQATGPALSAIDIGCWRSPLCPERRQLAAVEPAEALAPPRIRCRPARGSSSPPMVAGGSAPPPPAGAPYLHPAMPTRRWPGLPERPRAFVVFGHSPADRPDGQAESWSVSRRSVSPETATRAICPADDGDLSFHRVAYDVGGGGRCAGDRADPASPRGGSIPAHRLRRRVVAAALSGVLPVRAPPEPPNRAAVMTAGGVPKTRAPNQSSA